MAMEDEEDKQRQDPHPEETRYPAEPEMRPHVIVVGGGVAGMTAAHRLLERGHDVTLLEANSYLGGKLGAHQDRDELDERDASAPSAFGARDCKTCGDGCSRQERRNDWHEHCYHMYLNWYHNFWQLMRDIGTIDRFEPITDIHYLRADPDGKPITVVNPGSPATAVQNMTSGVASASAVFLHSQALRDLLATPEHADRRLDQISVEAFLREQGYTTAESRNATHGVLAKAFAAPTATASASSYKSFVKYGARLPDPSVWLLDGHTEEAVFTPWLKALARLSGTFEIVWKSDMPLRPVYAAVIEEDRKRERSEAETEQKPSFTLMPLTRLAGMEVDPDTGEFLMRIETLDKSPTPQPTQTLGTCRSTPSLWRFGGQVVLTIPPRQLARLVHNRAELRDAYHARTLAGADPSLVDVTRLNGAPIMTLDVVFRKPPEKPLPRGIVLLLDSKYEMSVYDNTQIWRAGDEEAPRPTQLSICASDAAPLMPFVEQKGGPQVIAWMLLEELRRFVRFDPETDVLHCRTHLQTNAGEELFINAVDTWHYRPRTTTAVPDLFIAGDFVQTPVDVVTIEGAAMSGLMAAEAVRRRTGVGEPIPIVVPDTLPGAAVRMAADALRPLAFAAKVMDDADTALTDAFRSLFPRA